MLIVDVSKYADVSAIDCDGIILLDIEVSKYALMAPPATPDTVEVVVVKGTELIIEVSRYAIEIGPFRSDTTLETSWLVVVNVEVDNTVTTAGSK